MAYTYNAGLQSQTQPSPPTHLQGGSSDNFILGSVLLQDYPNLLKEYFKNGSNPVPFLNKLQSMGFVKRNSKESDSPYTGHYEKPRTKNFFGISAIVTSPGSPVAGKPIVISILSTDMYSQTNALGTTVYYSRPRVTENYNINGNQYRIIAKDTTTVPSLHQLTLQPRKSTVDPTVDVVVGAVLFYVNPDQGEGRTQIAPLKGQRFKYQNTFTIIGESDVVSGSNLTTRVAFKPVPGKDNLLYLEGVEDMEIRHEQAKSNHFLWAQTSDQLSEFSNLLNETVPLTGSEGLIPFMKLSGRTINFTDSDSYDIDDITAVTNYFHDLAMGTTTVMCLKGRNLLNRTTQLWKQYLDNTNVSYEVTSEFMAEGIRNAQMLDPMFNAEAMFVDMDFSGYRVNHIKFLETALTEFNDIYAAGRAGYKDVQLIFPLGMFESEDKEMVPYCGYEWRGANGYSRLNEVWQIGGASALSDKGRFLKAIEDHGSKLFIRSEVAPHFGLGIQMVIQKPTNTVI